MTDEAYDPNDPSWGPSIVDERVWAAMQYIRGRAESLAAWNALTNGAPWTTAMVVPFSQL